MESYWGDYKEHNCFHAEDSDCNCWSDYKEERDYREHQNNWAYLERVKEELPTQVEDDAEEDDDRIPF